MTRNFIAPRAYVQGAGALAAAAEEFEGRLDGGTAYVLGGETALGATAATLTDQLDGAGIEVATVSRGVERCTPATIDEHSAGARSAGADVVVGVGGGVAMDVATAVADGTGAELVAVPTVASTDAPCSTIAVVYDDGGNFVGTRQRDRNPELVLVDTAVVADAPARFLRHGMGDAVATRFEAEAVARSNATTAAGGRSSHAAVGIAEHAHRAVAEHGAAALAAVRRDAVTPAVERVVEANTLLSGLGFESAGTAGAHAVQIGLTNAGVREPHGVLVAFGTVAELVHGDAHRETVADVVSLFGRLGLAVTLDDLGVDDATVETVGEVACDGNGMGREPVPATPGSVADAVRAADALLADAG